MSGRSISWRGVLRAGVVLAWSVALASLAGPAERVPRVTGPSAPPEEILDEPWLAAVELRLTAKSVALTGEPVDVLVELVDSAGSVVSSGDGIDITLSLSGSAYFLPTTPEGSALEQVGSSTASIDTVSGRARLLLSSAAPGRVDIVAERTPREGSPPCSRSIAVEFLSPDDDEDGDGLSNLKDLERGSDPLRPDTDDDGVVDLVDNCPAIWNADQKDDVHPNGVGDACDDPDSDALADARDDCPDHGNPDQSDSDGNGTGDACEAPAVPIDGLLSSFVLPFASTDVIIDPVRPLAYISQKPAKKLYFVNLETGAVEREFTFAYMPESLALTPDGSRLFVALLTREHSPYWWDIVGHEGYIASFDLETQVKDREFRIAEDPYDLVATSDGHLVVPSGSGQWTYIRVFDAVTGQQTGSASGIRHRSRLTLHPSEKTVYAANTEVAYFDRYNLLPGGRIAFGWYSPRPDERPVDGNLWASPLGDVVVTRGGDVFTMGATQNTDLSYLSSLTPSGSLINDLAWDAAGRVIFTGEGSSLRYYNLISRMEIGSQVLPGTIDFVGVSGEVVYSVISETTRSQIILREHPAPGGATNTPPDARFTVSPETGHTTLTNLLFDASSTTDAQDPLSALRFRWDFDDDGTWDTPFQADPTVVKRYNIAGTKHVRLQVRDSLALVSDQVQVFDVTFEPDPGSPGPPHTPFTLPFSATDVAFDPVRPYLYVSQRTNRKMCIVSLATGLIEREFTFTDMPESLAVTPDGSRLFVALLTREHHESWQDEDGHEGYIASFDLETQVKDREFRIAEDPYDLVATSDGHLVVPSGSGQLTFIRVFDAVTGQQTGSQYGINERSRLTLHPSEQSVYTAARDYPETMVRYDLRPGGGIAFRWSSPYPRDYRVEGNVWASPLGDVLVTRGGDVFAVGATQDTDLSYLRSLTPSGSSINGLAWDATGRVIFTAEGPRLRYYNLLSRMEIGSQALPGTIDFVGVWGGVVYSVISKTTQTQIIPREHPAPGGATNSPPEARFTVSPETDHTTRTDLLFDASSTTDAQDPLSTLRFRWDFDDDGNWDTPFQADPTAVKRYNIAGTKHVRLQVRDSLALVSDQVRVLDITFGPDPGSPGSPHTPFILPFSVTDALFDPVRPYLYVSQKANRKMYVVSLATGLIEREFTFTHMPESLAVTPDGSRLFVALLAREHSPYWFDGDHEGYIAGFDLQAQVKDREFRITEDPFDLVATSDGHLVVPSGSGQHTYIRVFDAVTGQETGSDRAFQGTRLTLHPSEHMVYVASTALYPSDIGRYDLLPGGEIAYRWDSPYHGDHRMEGNVWASPLGDALVTRGGDVFAVGASYGTDMRYVSSLPISVPTNDLAWNPLRREIVAVAGFAVQRYDLLTYEVRRVHVLSEPASFVGHFDDVIYALSSGETTRIATFTDKPRAVAGADVRVECQGARMALVSFDGSQSTDPNSSPSTNDDIVQFQWFEVLPDSSRLLLQEGEIVQVPMGLGTHRVVLRTTDTTGLANEDALEVVVEDTLPPRLSVAGDPATLWPPNHRMVEVHATVTVEDQCAPVTFALEAVISSEPDDAVGLADGRTTRDVRGVEAGGPDTAFLLRAERSGTGRGRIYTARYRAVDEGGNVASESVTFLVPHDSRGINGSTEQRLQDPLDETPRGGTN